MHPLLNLMTMHKLKRKKKFKTSRRKYHLANPLMDFQQSTSHQTHVSTTLATHLLLSDKFHNSNVVFSPFSMHVVLNILAAGCKGRTKEQVLGFLKAKSEGELNSLYSQLVPFMFTDGRPNGGPRLSVANGVWVDETLSLKPCFKQVVENVYKAACKQVDFLGKGIEAVNEVNLWAEKHTNGLIKQVLPVGAVNYFPKLIFTNALYFKGSWSQKFKRSETKEYDFHLLDGNKVQVPFMTSGRDQFVKEYDDFKVLGLPYSQGQDKRKFTMYFFLPHANDGLQSLVEKISSTSDFLDRHIPHSKVAIGKFLIPKFKISFAFEASNMLKELGILLPFDGGEGVTEMVEREPLSVSRIYHTSFVDVNEKGTEAAAVSILDMEEECGEYEDFEEYLVDFVADHSFLFVIREDVTGVVLFIGQVTDPSVGCKNHA